MTTFKYYLIRESDPTGQLLQRETVLALLSGDLNTWDLDMNLVDLPVLPKLQAQRLLLTLEAQAEHTMSCDHETAAGVLSVHLGGQFS